MGLAEPDVDGGDDEAAVSVALGVGEMIAAEPVAGRSLVGCEHPQARPSTKANPPLVLLAFTSGLGRIESQSQAAKQSRGTRTVDVGQRSRWSCRHTSLL